MNYLSKKANLKLRLNNAKESLFTDEQAIANILLEFVNVPLECYFSSNRSYVNNHVITVQDYMLISSELLQNLKIQLHLSSNPKDPQDRATVGNACLRICSQVKQYGLTPEMKDAIRLLTIPLKHVTDNSQYIANQYNS